MKKIFLFFITVSAFISCTKTINVDLKNEAPHIVIEGVVSNNSFANVRISKSVPFSNDNIFRGVSDARVSISDDHGMQYELTETSTGNYTNNVLKGTPGYAYNLSVMVEGKYYTATSAMPLQVNLDTLLLENISLMGKMKWTAVPQYTDPAGFGNSYKFIETINRKRYQNYWVWDDRIINDGVSNIPLFQMDSTVNLKDTIEVEMQCIDKNVYRYFTALANVKNSATTPANPESNIVGGALGYFSAHTSQKRKVVVE